MFALWIKLIFLSLSDFLSFSNMVTDVDVCASWPSGTNIHVLPLTARQPKVIRKVLCVHAGKSTSGQCYDYTPVKPHPVVHTMSKNDFIKTSFVSPDWASLQIHCRAAWTAQQPSQQWFYTETAEDRKAGSDDTDWTVVLFFILSCRSKSCLYISFCLESLKSSK